MDQATVVDNSGEQSAISPRHDWEMSNLDEVQRLFFLKRLMDLQNNKLDGAIAQTHTPVMAHYPRMTL